jgi:hypothetical protein
MLKVQLQQLEIFQRVGTLLTMHTSLLQQVTSGFGMVQSGVTLVVLSAQRVHRELKEFKVLQARQARHQL